MATKQLSIRVDEKENQEIQHFLVDENMTFQDMGVKAIREYMFKVKQEKKNKVKKG